MFHGYWCVRAISPFLDMDQIISLISLGIMPHVRYVCCQDLLVNLLNTMHVSYFLWSSHLSFTFLRMAKIYSLVDDWKSNHNLSTFSLYYFQCHWWQHLNRPCQSPAVLGWGLLSQFPPFRYFPNFSALLKQTLGIEYHVYIWQVSPQLSCGDTWQIWT